jgi:MscS family membrane protein
LGRSTPYGTVVGFIESAKHDDFERASQYLDVTPSNTDTSEVARRLYIALDRNLTADLDSLSRDPDGSSPAQLNPNRYRVGIIAAKSGSLVISLDRVQQENGQNIWLFSPETIMRISEASGEFKPPWVERYLPGRLVRTKFLAISLWRWIAIPSAIAIALLLSWLLDHLFHWVLRRSIRRLTNKEPVGKATVVGPILLLAFGIQTYGIATWGVSLTVRQFWYRAASTLTIVGAVWFICHVIELLRQFIRLRLQRKHSHDQIALVRLTTRLSKAAAVIAGTLVLLYEWNFDLTALLTGLGIGGLALAFAAQKTLENLFGGIMIITDRPIRVGDLCRAEDYLGTVEDIGLRSTRIRTVDHTVVSIPNGQLATMSLENLSQRKRISFNPTLCLDYATSPDQLRSLLSEISKMLREERLVDPGSVTVRFVGFGRASLECEVFAYVLVSTLDAYQEVQEALLLRIMEIIRASGSRIALQIPTGDMTHDPHNIGVPLKGKALASRTRGKPGVLVSD